ncbi:MAG: zinc-ribbon domain-containing protein [Deltaproteobacteria bacterium]|jgi:predicted Zn finger-like uncharacterized protein|nr:zinc-ribbon domain-containing protein [Deltaproteobacteria bacterium]
MSQSRLGQETGGLIDSEAESWIGFSTDQEPLLPEIAELTCPICGVKCLVSPSEFPEGETVAACSACNGQLVLGKGQDGTMTICRYVPKASETSQTVGLMHPVVCPKCLKRYRVPLAKLPKKGAWVTCLSCAERFVIKADDSYLEYEPVPAKRPKPNPIKAGPSKQHYLYRPGVGQDDYMQVAILDPVTPKVRHMWGLGLAIVIVAIFVAEAAILSSSWKSARQLADVEPVPVFAVPEYGEANLISDLRTIQGSMVSAISIDRHIAYTGGESRVFKYVVSRLAPDTCHRITGLWVKSQTPALGFNIKASCFDSRERSASLEIAWKGRRADLFLTGQERLQRLSVLLHPPEVNAATSASETAGGGAVSEAASVSATTLPQ